MKLAIASDHRGFEAKKKLLPVLRRLGHEVQDFGCEGTASCDYSDFAAPAARSVARGENDAAILLEGSGIGMSITANKVHGIRAALVSDPEIARLSREHNDANVLCLPGRFIEPAAARAVVKTWLETPFAGGRHERRVEKIARLEREESAR